MSGRGRARIERHGANHVPGGSDPIPGLCPNPVCIPGGTPLLSYIAALEPAAFWKLNESSGTVAHDSSGNGYDLDSSLNSTPGWGAAAGPPGEQTARFAPGGATDWTWLSRTATFPVFGTADFTAFGWAYWTNAEPADGKTLIGQGLTPARGFSHGWQVWITNGSGPTNGKLRITVNNGVGAGPNAEADSNAHIPESTWFAWAMRRSGTEWSLWVDGVKQTATLTSPSISASNPVFLGADQNTPNPTDYALTGRQSYVGIVGRALTDGEVASLAATATGVIDLTPAEGTVPISAGDGTVSWAPISASVFDSGTALAGQTLTSDGAGGATFAWPTHGVYVNGS